MSPHDHEQDGDEALAADELALLAYVDGELDGEALLAFQARLEGDRALRARVRALTAIGQFLRDDAPRVYAEAKVDSIVEGVMERLPAAELPAAELPAAEAERAPLRLVKGGASDVDVAEASREVAQRVSDVHPATSRGARRSKNTVVWGAFVLVAAAAAALVVFLRSNPIPETRSPDGVAPIATVTPSAKPTETVAIKPPAPAPAPIPESEPTLKVENLEVSEGASIIYTQNGESVVWLTGNEASK